MSEECCRVYTCGSNIHHGYDYLQTNLDNQETFVAVANCNTGATLSLASNCQMSAGHRRISQVRMFHTMYFRQKSQKVPIAERNFAHLVCKSVFTNLCNKVD